ncbi:MAG: DUF2147 domain-containing protein [Acidobacteriota bacterium]|nr:DUF2147 domain-containing protein [Acidobacteriota bacterium]
MPPRYRTRILLGLLTPALLLGRAAAPQEPSGVLGYWQEPEGSVIRIHPCGSAVCATLVVLSRASPVRLDSHNPDRALQHRPLCGLQIGQGFHLASPGKAEGGTLYDPKSGKTYRGAMTSQGDQLDLRGYIGFSVFGRTERWSRTAPVEACRS